MAMNHIQFQPDLSLRYPHILLNLAPRRNTKMRWRSHVGLKVFNARNAANRIITCSSQESTRHFNASLIEHKSP